MKWELTYRLHFFETTLNSLGFGISATIGDSTISFSGTPEIGKSFEITVNILSLKDDALDSTFGIKFTIDKFPQRLHCFSSLLPQYMSKVLHVTS